MCLEIYLIFIFSPIFCSCLNVTQYKSQSSLFFWLFFLLLLLYYKIKNKIKLFYYYYFIFILFATNFDVFSLFFVVFCCLFSLALLCDVLMEKFSEENSKHKKIMISHKINTTLYFTRTHRQKWFCRFVEIDVFAQMRDDFSFFFFFYSQTIAREKLRL